MKCDYCKTDVLESFQFCHQCGRPLMKAVTCATTVQKAPVNEPATFQEFRKRLSAKRQERLPDKGKKRKQDTTSEVMISIGRMKLCNGELVPVKGKSMVVRIPTTIKKLDLMTKAIEKHAAYDRKFDAMESYALLYPDGSEIITIPGQPTQLFQLDLYKHDVGKPYNRITLYLAERALLERSTREMTDSDQDSEADVLGSFLSKPTTTVKPASGIEHQSVVDIESSKEVAANAMEQAAASTSGVNDSSRRNEKLRSTNLQTLTDMFPANTAQQTVTALDNTNSLEEAIHLILGGGWALNDAYAALLSDNVDDHSQFDAADDDNLHYNDDVANDQTTFASDEALQKQLLEHKEKEITGEGFLRFKVRRQAIWNDTLAKMERLRPENLKKPVKVQFIGEPAVDQGGPSREFFALITSSAQEKLMSNGAFRHDISSMQNNEFLRFGQLTSLGILQGSPGPKCFSKSVVDYMLLDDISDLHPTIDEVPIYEVKDFLKKLDAITDEKTFKQLASFGCEFRFEAGYSKPFIEMKDKEEFFRCICLHYIVLSSISEMNQFVEGLKTFNLLDLIKKHPDNFRKLFQLSKLLTAELVDEIFEPVFSPKDSNKYAVEQAVAYNFNHYLEDVENGSVQTEMEGRLVTVTLKHVLQFVTGAEDIPAIGFTPRPTVLFSHDVFSNRKMSTNTCANVLTIPVANMSEYASFSEEFTFCMMNSPGFGVI